MPDLTTLRAGDTVHFRCGGSAVVNFVFPDDKNGLRIAVKGSTEQLHRKIDGRKYTDGAIDLLDIIRIEPKPFDWSEVKPGMAFFNADTREVNWYIGPNLALKNCVIVSTDEESMGHKNNIWSVNKRWITPTPEHDIEVSQ